MQDRSVPGMETGREDWRKRDDDRVPEAPLVRAAAQASAPRTEARRDSALPQEQRAEDHRELPIDGGEGGAGEDAGEGEGEGAATVSAREGAGEAGPAGEAAARAEAAAAGVVTWRRDEKEVPEEVPEDDEENEEDW